MSSYWKIVFGIKERYQRSDVLKIFKQQRFSSFLISQHNAQDIDNCCDRLHVHYHAILECAGKVKIDNFVAQLSFYCIFLYNNNCNSPVEYLAYITSPPKRTIAQEILHSSNLLEFLPTAYNKQFEVLERKKQRRLALLEQNYDTTNLVDFILKSGCSNNINILHRLMKNGPLWESLQKKQYKLIIEKALKISKKIILLNSILDLSERLETTDEYLSPEESARFVEDWCSYQNLNCKDFTRNLIRCLDKRSGNRNSICLQGYGNSGKSYIVQSIMDACIHYGQVKNEATAYPFAWEKCSDKRLIVISEPHFSEHGFETLDKILSGSGTIIYKHNDFPDYLQPTPVIILANEHEWTDNLQFYGKIKKRFCCCYMGLKIFLSLPQKKLHPRWLNILNKSFSKKTVKTEQQTFPSTSNARALQTNSDLNTEKGLSTAKPTADVHEYMNNHSPKSDGDRNLFKQQISYQDSGNTMRMNASCRKRPMSDTENDEIKNKLPDFGLSRGNSKDMLAHITEEGEN